MAAVERARRGQVEVLTLNRPEARNAVNGDVSAEMEAALDAAEADDDVGAVIVTGAGDVFCAGADLKAIASGNARAIETERGSFAGFVARDFAKPRIAAVNGAAVAGGFEIVLACDLVVAAETAVFGLPEVKRGLFAAAGGPFRLARRVPLATATEIVLTGDPIDAPRALALGLVNQVVPRDQVVDAAVALAERIAANAPVAVRCSLRMLREAPDLPEPDAWRRSGELAGEVFRSEDAREGPRAFAEKRPPRWTGR